MTILLVCVIVLPGQASADDDAVALDRRRHGERGRRDGDVHRLARAPAPDAAAVDVTTSNGSATAPADYVHKSERLTEIPAGGSKPFVVSIAERLVSTRTTSRSASPSRTLPDAVVGDGAGTGTITNDDGPPTISIGDVTVTEGNSGTVDANFVVSVSPASGKPITVQYSTGTGTATAGSDYVAAQDQTLTIPADQPSGTITIKINGDELAESSESFPVNIFNATNATISDGSGTATIIDNDAGAGCVDRGLHHTRGRREPQRRRDGEARSASQQTLTFDYRSVDNTGDGCATTTSLGGAVTFTPGQTERTIPLVIKGDRARRASRDVPHPDRPSRRTALSSTRPR